MLHSLVHLDFGAAWALNPVSLLFVPLACWFLADTFARAVRGHGLPRLAVQPWQAWGAGLLLGGFSVARNLL